MGGECKIVPKIVSNIQNPDTDDTDGISICSVLLFQGFMQSCSVHT